MRIKSHLVNLLFKASPALRKLAAEHAGLVADLGSICQERDLLARQLQAQAISQGVLNTRVAELTAQVRMQAYQGFHDGMPSQVPFIAKPPVVSRRAAKFVIFSNPRSGSTWLETSLGLLPDIYVDYELKWGITYAASELHVVLDQTDKTISQVLEDMDTDAPVVGSKFVVDVHGLTPPDFMGLSARMGSDVRVIHLTRNYRDVFLSVRRGFYHAAARTEALSERLRDAIERADVRRAPQNAAIYASPFSCLNELSRLLHNDLDIHSFRAAGMPYMQISYDKVGESFSEIAKFSGSDAAPEAIADALARPAIAKLPAVEADCLVSNLGELEPLFESFEILRQTLVVQATR